MIKQNKVKPFSNLILAYNDRDIKPANILFHNGQVKLADFGFCKAMQGRGDLAKTMVGSPICKHVQHLKNIPEVYIASPFTSHVFIPSFFISDPFNLQIWLQIFSLESPTI